MVKDLEKRISNISQALVNYGYNYGDSTPTSDFAEITKYIGYLEGQLNNQNKGKNNE